MILADTSVWVDHFRALNPRMRDLLRDDQLLMHPFVMGELACGRLPNRQEVLADLRELPPASVAEHDEVMELVERHRLWGRGIGWIDAHLLASARITGCRLWTLDGPLRAAAEALAVHVY